MLTAKEAKERTIELIKKDYNEKLKANEEFCETVCVEAIEKAIAERKYSTCVEIPEHLDRTAIYCILTAKKFSVSLKHGTPASVTIGWREVK